MNNILLTKLCVSFIYCLGWVVDPSSHSLGIPPPTLSLSAELTNCYFIFLLRLACVPHSVRAMASNARQVGYTTANKS